MAGLQRGILAVVGEGEQLARVRGEAGLLLHPLERRGGNDRGGRAAALGGERRQPVAVLALHAVHRAAAQAEAELARQKIARGALAERAVRRHAQRHGPELAVGLLQARSVGGAGFEPAFRVVFEVAGETEIGVARLHQEKTSLFALAVGVGGVLVLDGRDVIDVAR